MNQTHWRNGQTIGDILDLLAYSPSSDNESVQGQHEGDQPHRTEEQQVDLAGEQHGKTDKRMMRRPRQIV